MKSLKFIMLFMAVSFVVSGWSQKTYSIKNRYIERTLLVSEEWVLSTKSISNRRIGSMLPVLSGDEFRLRISDGTDKTDTDRIFTAKDFRVVGVSSYVNSRIEGSKGYEFNLENEYASLKVRYELGKSDFYARKSIEILPFRDFTLERIDVEAVPVEDAFQNYNIREIFSCGPSHWKPGLGQPLYTSTTASFWGVEFPAATNMVENGIMYCGYTPAVSLKADESYVSYYCVIGVAEGNDCIDDTFYDYIDRIRIRPARLQIQYNSWFDYGRSVDSESFSQSINTIHNELVKKRGCPPLDAYVIDDGWQDTGKDADWSDTIWTVSTKFSSDFKDCFAYVESVGSSLGLWLSPASILGGLPMVPRMERYGFESLGMGMSMTGPKYMQKLEDRILQLTRMGVSYFKFDGLFGHLNTRDFELKGRGTAYMPQLGLDELKGNEEVLNDSKYNELKDYYLCNGTERLMDIFTRMSDINPDIFIAITNGAYLSPWWMQYVDIVWLINAGDAAGGNTRNQELVYRDGIYYQIWNEENTKFPMNSIFNHEPKKTSPDKDRKTFSDYLYMNLSRGTGFIELYIKTPKLTPSDWDVMAEGLKWSHKMFPVFKRVRMHGGDPRKGQVYGYTAWNDRQGYISFHNPSDKPCEYVFSLDRSNGVPEDIKKGISCDFNSSGDSVRFPDKIKYGDEIRITLKPYEIIIVDFN